MKLLRLSANMATFQTIEFNQEGLTLISAHRHTSSNDFTYNSVGKSLAIYLIHFCLGASATSDFKTKLPEWTFRLDFTLDDGKRHYTSRSTEDSINIIYDDIEMKVVVFNKLMGKDVFNVDQDEKYLSFRSLISRFIRMGKSGYTKFDQFREKEYIPTNLINTSYLLGLDVQRIRNKVELKEEDDLLKLQNKNLAKDNIMKNFLQSTGSPEDIVLQLLDLDKLIEKLQGDIRNFVIAEDYSEIKMAADRISQKLMYWRNETAKCKIALENIKKSQERKPDIKRQDIVSFFKEANISLGENVVRTLKEVERFNDRLMGDRSSILSAQQIRYVKKMSEANEAIVKLEKDENEKLKYLNSHGALDDYTRLTELLANSKYKKEKLEQYKNLQKSYKQRREELKVEIANENIRTQEYLDSIEPLINKYMNFFHDLAKEFYGNKTAGLRITNNIGVNKSRYDIDARISDDSGDGINETKIFCFDWTLLTAQKNNNIKFLVHDNRIISETDPRQVATMLKIANRICAEQHFQYILTINEASLNLLRNEMTCTDYETIIKQNEVLELNDSSEKGKLLGIQVDLKYE